MILARLSAGGWEVYVDVLVVVAFLGVYKLTKGDL